MNIIIFGATGRTGNSILEEALKQEHIVTAFVRDASKIKIKANNLRIVTGDVLEQNTVIQALQGQDVVLCALGKGRDLSPTTLFSEGTKNIVMGMEKHGVKRIICLLSGWIFFKYCPPMFKEITEEHERQLSVLQKSGLEWIAVCPPQITDSHATGRYRIKVNDLPENGSQISKVDIANFMLLQISGNEYCHKAVGIAN